MSPLSQRPTLKKSTVLQQSVLLVTRSTAVIGLVGEAEVSLFMSVQLCSHQSGSIKQTTALLKCYGCVLATRSWLLIYHPPNPVYQTESLLNYIEACVEELSDDYPLTQIVISGDVNQLRVQEVEERTGLIQIVQQPTRGANILDCVFTSEQLYDQFG
jgi:hypothetical protein